MSKIFLFSLVLSLFLSELILLMNEVLGFIFYVVLITGCLFALSKAEFLDKRGELITILLIMPIFRITNLFLNIGFFWKNIVLYSILLFLVTFYCIKFKINPGYKVKGLLLLPLVIILGVFLGILGDRIFELEKYFGFIFLIPLIAYSEEVLFRGMIQNLVKENYGVFSSILVSSLLYGIFTISFGGLAIFMFFIGLILSLIYLFTKNIYLTIVINMILHFFLFVFPQISF